MFLCAPWCSSCLHGETFLPDSEPGSVAGRAAPSWQPHAVGRDDQRAAPTSASDQPETAIAQQHQDQEERAVPIEARC